MEFNGIEFRENFSGKLRKVRRLKGQTQEQFAEELGISISTYKKLEGKLSNPSVELLCQLKEATGLPVDYFIDEEEGTMAMSWSLIQTCSEYDKIELFARMIGYFGNNKCMELIKKCRAERG